MGSNAKFSSLCRLSSNFLFSTRTVTVRQDKRTLALASCDKMRYVQFKINGGVQHLGAQIDSQSDIFDLSAVNSSIPNSLVKFLSADKSFRNKAKRIIAEGKSVVPLAEASLLAPVSRPDKVACVGLNYQGHCAEQNRAPPTEPMFFSKFPSCIIGPNDPIRLPAISDCVDYEVELAVVIGKQGKSIRQDKAMEHVFGYTVAQDISARDWQKQRNNGQFLLGKTMDTFCPLGPVVVTKDKISDPHNLTIRSWVNGELKQDGNTGEMVFRVDYLVSYLSQIITLYPGDLILTGTPAGVGMHRNPAQYLKPGDILESEIQGIGRLRNEVI